jgi:hypothetical protein
MVSVWLVNWGYFGYNYQCICNLAKLSNNVFSPKLSNRTFAFRFAPSLIHTYHFSKAKLWVLNPHAFSQGAGIAGLKVVGRLMGIVDVIHLLGWLFYT